MGRRHQAREIALQLLYEYDARGVEIEDVIRGYMAGRRLNQQARQDAEEFARGVVSKIAAIDRLLERAAENWSLKRMLAVDRSILRLASYEIVFGQTAPAVAIDEALRLAKRFSSEDSPAFINGVLDRVKELAGQGISPGADKKEPS